MTLSASVQPTLTLQLQHSQMSGPQLPRCRVAVVGVVSRAPKTSCHSGLRSTPSKLLHLHPTVNRQLPAAMVNSPGLGALAGKSPSVLPRESCRLYRSRLHEMPLSPRVGRLGSSLMRKANAIELPLLRSANPTNKLPKMGEAQRRWPIHGWRVSKRLTSRAILSAMAH
jgi:hypothetical protein